MYEAIYGLALPMAFAEALRAWHHGPFLPSLAKIGCENTCFFLKNGLWKRSLEKKDNTHD
jgi:hypothetical protein